MNVVADDTDIFILSSSIIVVKGDWKVSFLIDDY